MSDFRRKAVGSYLLLASLLAACGGQQAIFPPLGTGVDATGASVIKHIEKATAYEETGALLAALREYKIAHLINPDEEVINGKIVELSAAIDRKAAKSRKVAIDYRKRGKVKKEKEAWLMLLSYRPNDKTALRRLRAMEQATEKRSLARKIKLSQKYYDESQVSIAKNIVGYEQEAFEYSRQSLWELQGKHVDIEVLLAEMQKHLAKYPEDEKIQSLFINACIDGAAKEFASQNYENSLRYLLRGKGAAAGNSDWLARILQVNRQYADELYAKGLEAYRDDVSRAAGFWRLALRYDPQMGRARLRLKKITSTGSEPMEH